MTNQIFNSIEKPLTRKSKKLGYSPEEAKVITAQLNLLLSNLHLHYQKLRNFHWNVKGTDFFELHEVFEKLYNQVAPNIDRLAERIRIFGATPFSNFSTYLENSEIKEAHTELSSSRMVGEILSDFEILLSFMVDSSDAAAEMGDIASMNMIQDFIEQLEKNHWMLSTWLQTK